MRPDPTKPSPARPTPAPLAVPALSARKTTTRTMRDRPSLLALFFFLTSALRIIAPGQDDDEFEEFEQQEWTTSAEDVQDPAMWQDGWEDDEDDADFTAQLRAELAATEGQAPPTGALAEKMEQ